MKVFVSILISLILAVGVNSLIIPEANRIAIRSTASVLLGAAQLNNAVVISVCTISYGAFQAAAIASRQSTLPVIKECQALGVVYPSQFNILPQAQSTSSSRSSSSSSSRSSSSNVASSSSSIISTSMRSSSSSSSTITAEKATASSTASTSTSISSSTKASSSSSISSLMITSFTSSTTSNSIATSSSSSSTPTPPTSCSPGTYSPTGVLPCLNCNFGDQTCDSRGFALTCLAGYGITSPSISCSPCLAGTASIEGSITCSKCIGGSSWSKEQASSCLNCNLPLNGSQIDSTCVVTTGVPLNCSSGYGINSTSIGGICTACLGNTGSEGGSGACLTCPDESLFELNSPFCDSCDLMDIPLDSSCDLMTGLLGSCTESFPFACI